MQWQNLQNIKLTKLAKQMVVKEKGKIHKLEGILMVPVNRIMFLIICERLSQDILFSGLSIVEKNMSFH